MADQTVDELARTSGLPVRTIREYQTLGLLPPPARRGRVGIYSDAHERRLALIARLQERGYSLAGIGDLMRSWGEGGDLSDVLGLEPDELVHVDEPHAPATLEQLAQLLPDFVPARLDELVAVGMVERCGPDAYAIPSPSLVQFVIDLRAAGYKPDALMSLLDTMHNAAQSVADAVFKLSRRPPPGFDAAGLDRLATRGRGLLAHATGRLTIYALGRRLGRVRNQ